MLYLPSLLYGLALVITICVQSMGSPLAGAWLFFIACSLGIVYEPVRQKDILWKVSLAWMITLGIATFILAPVSNGAATMFILLGMPVMSLCISSAQLRLFLQTSLIVLTLYALVLIAEMVFHVRYTDYGIDVPSRMAIASSWPLLDPNNAACLMNFGLIPCFYLGLRDKRWFTWFAVFAFALYGTNSRTGAICAAIACYILLVERYSQALAVIPFAVIGALLYVNEHGVPDMPDSLLVRYNIIHASLPLLTLKPFTGLGLGTFGYYYAQLRTETSTAGVFLHNDFLQLAIEMGLPCILVFLALFLTVLVTTTHRNVVALAVCIAVLIHSMMEFQFYLPSISLLMGLALAYHRITRLEPQTRQTYVHYEDEPWPN